MNSVLSFVFSLDFVISKSFFAVSDKFCLFFSCLSNKGKACAVQENVYL